MSFHRLQLTPKPCLTSLGHTMISSASSKVWSQDLNEVQMVAPAQQSLETVLLHSQVCHIFPMHTRNQKAKSKQRYSMIFQSISDVKILKVIIVLAASDQLEIILNISVGPTHLCPFWEENWPAQFPDGSSMQIHCYQFLETEMLNLFTPLGHQPGLR